MKKVCSILTLIILITAAIFVGLWLLYLGASYEYYGGIF